jgi:hypothetical protein
MYRGHGYLEPVPVAAILRGGRARPVSLIHSTASGGDLTLGAHPPRAGPRVSGLRREARPGGGPNSMRRGRTALYLGANHTRGIGLGGLCPPAALGPPLTFRFIRGLAPGSRTLTVPVEGPPPRD